MAAACKLEPQRRSDVESPAPDDFHLYNDEVDSLSWDTINVRVPDKAAGQTKGLLWDLDGEVKAGESSHNDLCTSLKLRPSCPGEVMAIMGPSGCGKTTVRRPIGLLTCSLSTHPQLLNVLARRPVATKGVISGGVYINSAPATLEAIRQVSCYVEQEDSLIGSLTARETLDFAARLSLPRCVCVQTLTPHTQG